MYKGRKDKEDDSYSSSGALNVCFVEGGSSYISLELNGYS